MLEPATPNTIPNCIQSLPPLVEIDREEEYKISEILNSKIDHCRKCKLQYLVHWLWYKGTDEETSWILADEVHASKMVSDFHKANPHKLDPLRLL